MFWWYAVANRFDGQLAGGAYGFHSDPIGATVAVRQFYRHSKAVHEQFSQEPLFALIR